MKLTIQIDSANVGCTLPYMQREIGLVLKSMADAFEGHCKEVLRDINGNTVGSVEFDPEPLEGEEDS